MITATVSFFFAFGIVAGALGLQSVAGRPLVSVAGVAGSFFHKKKVSQNPGILYYLIEVVAEARTGTGHSYLSWHTFC